MKLPSSSRPKAAFTLVELLVVMAIMVVLIGLASPAINAIQRNKSVTTAAYEIMDSLETARSYALANNTYVFWGIEEVDATVSSSATPQVVSTNGGGRIGVAVIATKDGTLGCSDPTKLDTQWSKDYAAHKGSIFTVVRKLQVLDNIHMGQIGSPPLSGNMARTNVPTTQLIGGSAFPASLTAFSWPLGADLTKGQYNFTRVIVFNPQGAPNNYYSNPAHFFAPSLLNWFELAFQQTKGNIIPPQPTNQNVGNNVAILLNGVTGTTRLYRP